MIGVVTVLWFKASKDHTVLGHFLLFYTKLQIVLVNQTIIRIVCMFFALLFTKAKRLSAKTQSLVFFNWAITNSQIYSWAYSNPFCRSLQDKIRFDAASTGLGDIHHWDEFCCYFSIYEDAVWKWVPSNPPLDTLILLKWKLSAVQQIASPTGL